MTRLLIVDDQELVLAGLRRIFDMADDFELVGEAQDGAAALERLSQQPVDVVVTDVRMPGIDGRELILRARQAGHVTPFLVLTTFDDEDTLAACLDAGATGFALKDAPALELLAATRAVARGAAWLDPVVAARHLDRIGSPGPIHADGTLLQELTIREREVLRLVGLGLSNGDISARLYLSQATVKTHLNRIFTKLDVRDRAAAVILCFRSGLVTLTDEP